MTQKINIKYRKVLSSLQAKNNILYEKKNDGQIQKEKRNFVQKNLQIEEIIKQN